MSAHTGKIGRLPKAIRNQIGQRLAEGVTGKAVVNWLNHEPEVRKALRAEFGGRAITEQNLSEWRQRGFAEWQREQAVCGLVRQLVEHSDALGEDSGQRPITDRFALVVAAEIVRLATTLLEKETDAEKQWKRLIEVNRELSLLRRGDHRAMEAQLRQEHRAAAAAQNKPLAAERDNSKLSGLASLWTELMANMCGGGNRGQSKPERLHPSNLGLPVDEALAKLEKASQAGVRATPTTEESQSQNPRKSESIRPNPT